LCKVRLQGSLCTDFTEGRELFRILMEEAVLSVCSVYKKRVLSSDFATAITLGVDNSVGLPKSFTTERTDALRTEKTSRKPLCTLCSPW